MTELEAIDAFLSAMRERSIDVDVDIIADGKIHRAHVKGDPRGSRNAWYVLFIDDRPAGKFGCNKRYGSETSFTWSSGLKSQPMTADERRQHKEKSARQRAEREAKERERHEAAAARAAEVWDQAVDCTEHPYLTRKGIRSHGLRVGRWEKTDPDTGEVRVISRQALLIPLRDVGKRIHSLQAIFPEKTSSGRDKDYLKDGAKQGLFYSMGRPLTMPVGGVDRQVIMIGEGYATMASAHECTGHAAIVAFDAGNLLPVGQAMRRRFPDACLLFLADNDQWTTTPINNPGVHHARRAAAEVGGLVAIPQFSPGSDDDRPTDFNDLHVREGADAVRDTIAESLNPPETIDPEPEQNPPVADDGPEPAPIDNEPGSDSGPSRNGHFSILGYNRGVYYVFLFGKRQIAEITTGNMSEKGLIEMAPLNWWELNFPGDRTRIDTNAAAEFIVRTAEIRGIYDPSRVRGRGAWVDDGRLVYHHGDYLTVDGKTVDITDLRSRYVYELDRSLPHPDDVALTDSEGERLLHIARQFRWTKPCSAALLAGWVALAPICGALKWRPHIWLTGGAGCGKSTVLDKYAHHLLGGVDLYAQGNSSEAGIRQTLLADARPVLFDESESNEEGDARRVQNVLSLIRQSSTESEAQTLKGTAGGVAQHFHIRSMFCLASIQVALKQQADIERLTVLALKPKRDDVNAAQTWEDISSALYEIHRDTTLPARLMRRSMNLLPTTLKNVLIFANAAAERFGSQRDGDQYGTLLAGAWSLISTEIATKQQAQELIDSYDWSEHREQNDTDESQRALSALMEAHIRIKGGIDVTVYELVCAAYGSPTSMADVEQASADAILQRHGMRVRGDRLMLSNNSDALRKLMAGTTFAADYRGLLLRVDGADRNDNRPARFNGVLTKCFGLALGPIVSGDRVEPAF